MATRGLEQSASCPDAEVAQEWEVVGGEGKGGVLVRSGESLTSDAESMRLSTGSVVRQLALAKDRLHYQLLSGSGPERGFVTVRLQSKDLLIRRQVSSLLGSALPSSPSKELSSARSRPLRVLALHGGGSNANIMKYQTTELRKSLGNQAEWDFLNGRRLWKDQVNSEMMVALSKGEPFRGWYAVECEEDGGPTDRSYHDKLFDKSVKFTYDEVETGVDYVLAHIQDHGPFDVLLGFSQGCIVTHLIAATLRQRGQAIPWALSVFFCGIPVRDNKYMDLFNDPLPVRSVQIYGKEDEMYDYGKSAQPGMYVDPIILEHTEGHKFPTRCPHKAEIYERVCQEMLACRSLRSSI